MLRCCCLGVLLVSFGLTFIGCARTPALQAGTLASNASSPMAGDPSAALNHLRLLEYQNAVDEVLAYLATPAATEFVLKRSRAATRKNIAKIQEGAYGFEVLDGKARGDAGVTILRVVDLASANPIKITPFYVWRINGLWHFLPNPTVVTTWYQAVPAELIDDYAELGKWYAQRVDKMAQQPSAADSAEDLLARYWSEMGGPNTRTDHDAKADVTPQ